MQENPIEKYTRFPPWLRMVQNDEGTGIAPPLRSHGCDWILPTDYDEFLMNRVNYSIRIIQVLERKIVAIREVKSFFILLREAYKSY